MNPINHQTDNLLLGNIILEEAGRTVEDAVIVGETPDRVMAQGTLQDLDVQNRNKRCYATADMRPQIYGDRLAELMRAKQLKGEAGHPMTDSIIRQQTIDPKMCCVNYLKMWIDKGLVKAEFRGTNDDGYGKTFDKDLRAGELPAFSLRALGNIENINGKSWVKNLRVITYDHVIYPSHKAAYTEKLLTESAKMEAQAKANEMEKILMEGAVSDGLEDVQVTQLDERIKQIDEVNECGKVIQITGEDAQNMLNIMQRENASIGMVLEAFEGFSKDLKVVDGKLRLTTAYGETMYLNLDNFCDNLIMEYAYSKA